ncbi:6-bladed beta-propeller [Algoriphagus alkaliphilus]|uniref:6-bladed beta-propeller n=1 Tax=Algoriphagus alkaliphilus TaxID=279824 RepID=UPI0015873222|nr:6-bladed beta-propeller [Algoriphagus alkaliphilus]
MLTSLLLGFSLACSSGQKEPISSLTNFTSPVSLKVDSSIPFKWPDSLVVEKITYLKPLDNHIVSYVDKFIVSPSGEHFYVFDRNQSKIFVFDDSGNPKQIFDRMGDGPAEYLEIRDVQIDFENDILEILDYLKLKRYKLSTFEYISTEDLRDLPKDKNFTNFCRIGDILYLWTPLPPNQRVGKEELGTHHLLRVENGNTNFYVEKKFGVIDANIFYPAASKNEFNISGMLGSTDILGLTKDSVYTKFRFDYGDKEIPLFELMNYWERRQEILSSEFYTPPQIIRETNNHLYFWFGEGARAYNLLYDKNTKSVISIGHVKKIIDDLVLILSDSTYLYGYMPSVYLIDYIENGGSLTDTRFFKDLDPNTLEKDENPIIVKFRLPYPESVK